MYSLHPQLASAAYCAFCALQTTTPTATMIIQRLIWCSDCIAFDHRLHGTQNFAFRAKISVMMVSMLIADNKNETSPRLIALAAVLFNMCNYYHYVYAVHVLLVLLLFFCFFCVLPRSVAGTSTVASLFS